MSFIKVKCIKGGWEEHKTHVETGEVCRLETLTFFRDDYSDNYIAFIADSEDPNDSFRSYDCGFRYEGTTIISEYGAVYELLIDEEDLFTFLLTGEFPYYTESQIYME